jgi:imidazolonepropionase-like amidohydrolase
MTFMHRELDLLAWEVIEHATRVNAELMGLSDDIGSLEPGKYAEIIAVRRNPLEKIETLENISFVMKGGVPYTALIDD